MEFVDNRMDRDEADAQFFRVKLACQSYAGNPCIKSLKTILESVEIESRIHSLVASYLMYPICLHLKYSESKIKENFAELAFRILSQTLKRTNVNQLKTFLELYGTLCLHLDSESLARKNKFDLSEEIKVQILSAISGLFKATDSEVVRQFYRDTQNKKQLGFLIFLLFNELGIKQGNKIPFLVVNIIMALLSPMCQTRQIRYTPNKTLFNTSLHYDFLWSAVKKFTESYFIQKELIFFLPGVTSKLINFIISEANPSASLIAAAILAFANFVAYTCNNKFYKYILDSPSESPPDSSPDDLQVELTKSWWEQTSAKLASLYVSATQICIAHENFKTRLCLLEAAAVLLANCQASLSSLTTALVDTLIVLSADGHEFVRNYAIKIITTFSSLPCLTSFHPLLLRIEELTYSLPNVAHNLNDTNKLPVLRLLTGYLNLIGKAQLKIGNSNIRMKECLKNLVKTLTSVLEFDMTDDSLLSQVVIQSDPQEMHLDKLKIVFTNLGENSSHAILDVLHSIGQYCVLDSILGYIFELAEREKIRKELIFILNHLIVGSVKTQTIDSITESVETIIPLYLQAEWIDDLDKGMYVLLRNTSQFGEEANLPTILALKRRTMQQILILEGLGHFAIALGSKFQPFLVTTIFPLLEKSNNFNSYIQAQSFDSLQKICSALDFPSIQTLIHSNADYITNVISLQFFQECTSQSALDVLQAVFRNSSEQLLPLLEDSVNFLLKSIRFYHTNDESVILLPTLVVISNQLFKWQQNNSTPLGDTTNPTSDNSTENIISKYREYMLFYFPKQEPEDKDTTPMEQEQQQQQPEEEKQPELLEDSICIDIIDSISYYINFPTPRITGFALRVVTNCLLALQTNMDKALPILHRIWPHLVSCIKTNAAVIQICSLQCLTQLSHHFGYFLISKVKKDIWLFFVEQLGRLSCLSRDRSSYYLHTQDFKIQSTMVQCLPIIALDLKIRFTEFHQLLAVYHLHCSLSQPRILRDEAIGGLSILAKINPGSVYFLITLLDPNEYGEVNTKITHQ